MKQPNILLIMTDEMRGDCVGVRHPDVKTPYLDTLIARGTYFPNAVTACPSCIAARAGLFTGLTPRSHGRVGYRDRIRWDYPVTLGGEMTKLGYQTQVVGKMHVHPLRSLQGFMGVELHDGYLHSYRSVNTPLYENQYFADDYIHFLKNELGANADIIDTGLECNSWVARPWCYEERLHPTNWATDRSIDFLRRRDRDKPFFLMTSYVRPHAPYDAPQAFFDMYKDKELTPPIRGDWDDESALRAHGREFNNIYGSSDPEQIRAQQVGYYACITHIDYQIGRLIQTLTDDGSLSDTIIMFISDHGEMLSDHCFIRKSLPYRGSANIPFIVSGPGVRSGAVSQSVAELRDVLPTLVELGGGEVPESIEGLSLKGELTDGTPISRGFVHGEHTYGSLGNHFIVTAHDKYVWFTQSNSPLGREQYFNLDKDPDEKHNAINDEQYAARIAEMRGWLIEELEGRPEGYVQDGKLVGDCAEMPWIGDCER